MRKRFADIQQRKRGRVTQRHKEKEIKRGVEINSEKEKKKLTERKIRYGERKREREKERVGE